MFAFKKNSILFISGLIFFLVCSYFGIKWLHYRFTHAITDASFVKSDLVEISPLVSGRIKTLFIDESDHVKEGQLIALLDDVDYQAEVNFRRETLGKAEHQVEEAEKNLKKCEETLKLTQIQVPQQIKEAENALKEAREIFRKAETERERITRDYKRLTSLYKEGAVEKKRLDDVTAAYQAALADTKADKALICMREARYKSVKALIHRIEIARQDVTIAKARIKTLQSIVKEAQSAMDIARVKLEHTRILAKGIKMGIVAKRHVEEGEFVSPGFPVFTLYDTNNLYITANLEERKIAPIKLGQSVDLKVDAFPREKFHGKVIKIGEATGAEFALIPRDVSTGEFTKVIQRVPIKIAIIDSRGLLKPGLSVTVGIKLKSN
ncbi:MAG: HlyD family secretion protein [Thermodesulfobacteriota bacterium]|nr:HlyD family secretion protein [Thermodesulfobacteriota bacterium]